MIPSLVFVSQSILARVSQMILFLLASPEMTSPPALGLFSAGRIGVCAEMPSSLSLMTKGQSANGQWSQRSPFTPNAHAKAISPKIIKPLFKRMGSLNYVPGYARQFLKTFIGNHILVFNGKHTSPTCSPQVFPCPYFHTTSHALL